jgi:hypothetical protein
LMSWILMYGVGPDGAGGYDAAGGINGMSGTWSRSRRRDS